MDSFFQWIFEKKKIERVVIDLIANNNAEKGCQRPCFSARGEESGYIP